MTGIVSPTDPPVEDGSAVDSQVPDSVAHDDDNKTWRDAVLASLRPRDCHLTDDEIFEILNAGDDREAADALFAAKGVTLPMYCVWKTKYGGLSLEELRELRRREQRRGRSVVVVLIVAGMVGAGGIVFGLARAAQATFTRSTEARVTAAVPITGSSAQPAQSDHQRVSSPAPDPQPPRVPEPQPTRVPEPQPTRVPEPQPTHVPEPQTAAIARAIGPDVLPATTSVLQSDPGYKIQVAAAPTMEEGRALLERLKSAGYKAYMLTATVNNAEVFRVRVGPFDTLPEAEETASRLHRDGHAGAWIAR